MTWVALFVGCGVVTVAIFTPFVLSARRTGRRKRVLAIPFAGVWVGSFLAFVALGATEGYFR
jgi:hypothetical protein